MKLMKKSMFGLILLAVICVNISIVKESKDSAIDLNHLTQIAHAGSEGQYFPTKQDRYDPIRQCYYQCIDPGSGCHYVFNYEYAC